MIPEPGTEYGPCVPTCEHIDCANNREMAERLCYVCLKRIGYSTRFVQRSRWRTLAHDSCLDPVDGEPAGRADARVRFLALP